MSCLPCRACEPCSADHECRLSRACGPVVPTMTVGRAVPVRRAVPIIICGRCIAYQDCPRRALCAVPCLSHVSDDCSHSLGQVFCYTKLLSPLKSYQ